MIESNCLDCHVKGGIGPFPLDTWDAVSAVSAQVVAAVTMGIMPPWPANPDCRELRDDRALPPAVRDLFTQWQADAYPEGDAADYKAPMKTAMQTMPEATLTLSGPAKYTPAPNADDYRCFVVPYTFDKDTYLTAMDIVPDDRAEVHHVQIHRIAPDQLALVQAMDAGDGYSCLVGTGAATQNMFSWRPVARASSDKGDAAFIEAGIRHRVAGSLQHAVPARGHVADARPAPRSSSGRSPTASCPITSSTARA